VIGVEDDAAAVLSSHRDRMRSIDSLLPEPDPLPEAVDGDTALAVAGAAGLARRILVDPTSLAATWGAVDQRWLLAQVTGPPAMAALLARWREHLAGPPAPGSDSSAIVGWPSRDVAMTPVFLTHGLIPDLVIAVRPAGRPTDATSTTSAAINVRRANPADLDDVVALRMEEVRFGAQLSGLPQRPSTAALMRDRYAAALAADQPWVWLADRDGEAIGLVSVTVGEQAAWIAPHVAATPVAYIDCAAVAPAHRSSGVAAALIRHVHHTLDAAGVAVTLLHYGALNPLSAPFWHRSGYRPLRTRWQLSPAR
jgi:ribosomal protein S18 acetylase RimI-like enzyme